MSENPNPTVCGVCHTKNPPGAERCIQCGAPLTAAAEPAATAGTPERIDEARSYAPGGDEALPEHLVTDGRGDLPQPLEPSADER